jgi:hypothetical protein|tara:strand:+ start:3667 stop:3888 length:222 start_codon:yes stop_codon:yes gene_type:complete
MGIKDTLAINAVKKNITQNTVFAFPLGLGNASAIGFFIVLNTLVLRNKLVRGTIMSIEHMSETKVNNSFQYQT